MFLLIKIIMVPKTPNWDYLTQAKKRLHTGFTNQHAGAKKRAGLLLPSPAGN